MVKRGLYVGRFQPLHLGHLNVISRILDEVDEIVIIIGSAQYSHVFHNPFTAGERLVMFREALVENKFDTSRIWVIPVPDVHLHMMWVSAVEGYTPHFDVVYSNEPITRRLFIEKGYTVKNVAFYKRKFYSSTKIREMMLKREKWESLVPKSVAKFLKNIEGVNRLRELVMSDNV